MIFLKRRGVIGALAIVAAAFVATGCPNPSATPTPTATSSYKNYLYMTDTVSGKVYTYDPASQSASSTSYATVGKNATGEIQFYKGIGYAAVGYGTDEGVYYFDPSATNPSFAKLGSAIAAQYFAFYSATKVYVTAAGTWKTDGTDTGSLYSFNPSNPSAGLTQVAAVTRYAQEAIIGDDGMLYVATATPASSGQVLKIDPSNSDSLVATYSTGASGTTGLAWGSFGGSSGVFVASSSGVIQFIPKGSADGAAPTPVVSSGCYAARLVQLPSGNLVATGYGHSYLVSISGTDASSKELYTGSSSSFGSLDIAYKDGLVYIPVASSSDYINYTNCLYVLDSSGAQKTYSPVYAMGSSSSATSTQSLSNIGFYE